MTKDNFIDMLMGDSLYYLDKAEKSVNSEKPPGFIGGDELDWMNPELAEALLNFKAPKPKEDL